METVNINEFFVANLNFTIQDQDVGFGDNGELIGYSEVGGGYFGDDRVEVEHTPLCDTTSLSDDCTTVAETRIVEVETGMTLQELYATSDDWVDASELEWMREEDQVVGRWAHAKDAHCDEREAAINLYKRLDTKGRPFGEMETLGEWRKQRFFAMVNFIDKCDDQAKLRRMQKEVWKRYINSVKSCAKSGDWFALYLTKRDARDVSDFITEKRNALLGR